MITPQGWFGMWACHCSQLETDRDAIPDLCPIHDQPLMRTPETASGPRMDWGFSHHTDCMCPDHDRQDVLL